MEPDPQGNKTSETPKKEMTKEDASRIQRAEAKKHGGEVKKGDFAPRAQAAADKHENEKKQRFQFKEENTQVLVVVIDMR